MSGCYGLFDNHQDITSTKFVTKGKSSINHVGMAVYIREHKPYILPFFTFMTSPLGIPFLVLESNYHSDTHLRVTDAIMPDYFTNIQESNNTSDQICCEINRIMGGFLYP